MPVRQVSTEYGTFPCQCSGDGSVPETEPFKELERAAVAVCKEIVQRMGYQGHRRPSRRWHATLSSGPPTCAHGPR
jgi:hypothetical protein